MFWKLRMIYRALYQWSAQSLQFNNRVDVELLERLSPIDRYVVFSGLGTGHGLFHPSYVDWRARRITKILEIYGLDYFKGKRILELGCGHGDIGAFFAELGADVVCLDGRAQNVNFARLKHRKIPNLKFEQFNLENDFSHVGKFDLVINFGLIYHLKNVEDHLRCCFSTADDVVLETVVLDSTDPSRIVFCDEKKDVDEEALEGVGSRPSPHFIERIAEENGFACTRYFTRDLNSGDTFSYDWKHRNNERGAGSRDFSLRRFWRFTKLMATHASCHLTPVFMAAMAA